MNRIISVLALLVMTVLASCGGGGSSFLGVQQSGFNLPPPSSANSGIEGTVMATTFDTSGGPVQFVRQPLPDATIDVQREAGGPIIAQVTSNSEGRFRVNLEPGSYSLIPRTKVKGTENLVATVQAISVSPDRFTTALIEYQSDRFGLH